jgi:glycosyltransferase involved in cell wall biosynthesis
MKIIISINTTWNIFNFRVGLIKALQSQGHQIIALSPKDEYVERLEEMGVQHIPVKIDQKGINPIRDLNLIKQYHIIFKSIRPDLILSYTIKPNIYGNLAAKRLKIPTINNISGLGTLFINSNIITSYIGKLLYKIGLSSSKHVFFQNQEDQALFIQSRFTSDKNSSLIPGSGVNIKHFKCSRITNKGKRFLFSGRLIGDKGIFEYLEAAIIVLKKFPDVEFILAGEIGANNKTAISEDNINGYIEKYSQFKYLGKSDNMLDLLKTIDVMVLPSYREGLSKSLLEAGAMKIPIITSDVPGCRDIVTHGYNGFLCKVKSVDSLARIMEEIIEITEETRLQMGLNGRINVEQYFSEEKVIKHYLNEINKLQKS